MGLQHANRLKFKDGYQEKFFVTLIKELNSSQRKLAKKLEVPRSTLRNWIKERLSLPENIFLRCVKVVPKMSNYRIFITFKYPKNWGQIKGGKVRSKMKNNLTIKNKIQGFRTANLKNTKKQTKGPKGEKMYNEGERRLAQFFLENGIKYEYEPLINLGKRYAFPDFIVRRTIIERCGYSDWPGYWNRMIKKAKLYEKFFKGKFIIVVPSNRFEIAVRRISPHVKSITILKENEIDILPNFIM